MRGAWLHVLTDALASALIGLLVIYSSWSLIRQSVAVLMENAPGHIDVDQVRSALLELPHVVGVHDLHAWTITSGFVALSAPVICPGSEIHDRLLRGARKMLGDRFGIRHTTIQIDLAPSCRGTDHPHAH